jgi:gluconolactonase
MRTEAPARAIAAALAALLLGAVATAAEPDLPAPGIPDVIAPGTPVQFVADGFNGSEGPIGLPDGTLLFTETRANRILAVDANDRISTFLDDTNGANGLALDDAGRLYAVQTRVGSMRVGIIHPAAEVATLADGVGGVSFNRPNDLVIDRQGGIFFTDPGQALGPDAGKGLLPVSVYYITPARELRRVATGIAFPNGVLLGRDESVLYVNDSRGAHMLAFDVRPGGELVNPRAFASYEGVEVAADGGLRSGADGLAIDTEGRLYAGTYAGVQVFAPDGRHLGTIPTQRPAQNLAFAGADKGTLYVVARGALLKVRMLSRGFAGRAK